MTDEWQHCAECGVRFGAPAHFFNSRRADKRAFYCPNGHSLSWHESEADRLKAKLQKQEQETRKAQEAAEREHRWRKEATEQARHLERRLAAQRGVTTRMKNRVSNGVCPCCNRTFINLQRHMATKHAGFVAEEVQLQERQTIQ
jgi:peptide methionine sulfoxide reductase MsrB